MNNANVLALLLCLCTTSTLAQHEQLSYWKAESRNTRLSVDLLQLQQAYLQHQAQRGNTSSFQSPNQAISYSEGAIPVEIIVDGKASALLSAAENIGMTNLYAFQRVLNGTISIQQLDQLTRLPDIISINPVYANSMNVGTAETQGDRAQKTQKVRQLFGLDGTGVKVGVLSDSYNYQGGAAAGIASGDLPGNGNPNGYTLPVDVLADHGTTDEGRAMLEVIHDIAPGAELAFHTAKGGSAAFAQGILDLAELADCDIIVDDIIYKTSPFFQDGIIAQAVDSVHAMGVTYFTSAGNQGDNSYETGFQEGELYHMAYTDVYGRAYSNDLIPHDFAPGDAMQAIRIPQGSTLTLALQWTDRYTSISGLPGPESDIDFFLLSADGEEVLAASANNNAYSDPVELLSYTNNTGAELKANLLIGLVSGPAPALIKYVSYGSMWADEYLEGAATCIGHANAAGAITVGAAGYHNTPEFGVDDPTLQSFSSRGGAPVFYAAENNRSANGIVRNKPDIVAPDGGDNTFFGGDTDGNGLPNFFGTSAAAPHAAGLAALLLELNRGLAPDDIRQLLQSTTTDMEAGGFDYQSGWGLIDGFTAALSEARYAPEVLFQESDQYLPGKEFTGNGQLRTDMKVSSGIKLTSAEGIRLLPGFKTERGVTFSAKVDKSVAVTRPEEKDAGYRPVELHAVSQPVYFATTSLQTDHTALTAYPSPFRQSTTISFEMPQEQQASLQVMDAAGQSIAEVFTGVLPSGLNSFTFNGQSLPAGVYYLVLERNGQQETLPIVKQ